MRKTKAHVEWFLNSAKAEALLGKARAKALGHQGGLVRKIAQQSIRRKGKSRTEPKTTKAKERRLQEIRREPASPPGTPPFTHTGFLRQDIQYALDPTTRFVAVGPYRSPWLNELHEFGGALSMTQYRRGDDGKAFWYRSAAKASRQWKKTGKTKMFRYPARSFMGPAFRRAMERLPSAWEATIR